MLDWSAMCCAMSYVRRSNLGTRHRVADELRDLQRAQLFLLRSVELSWSTASEKTVRLRSVFLQAITTGVPDVFQHQDFLRSSLANCTKMKLRPSDWTSMAAPDSAGGLCAVSSFCWCGLGVSKQDSPCRIGVAGDFWLRSAW